MAGLSFSFIRAGAQAPPPRRRPGRSRGGRSSCAGHARRRGCGHGAWRRPWGGQPGAECFFHIGVFTFGSNVGVFIFGSTTVGVFIFGSTNVGVFIFGSNFRGSFDFSGSKGFTGNLDIGPRRGGPVNFRGHGGFIGHVA
jgi:hypothetical protein